MDEPSDQDTVSWPRIPPVPPQAAGSQPGPPPEDQDEPDEPPGAPARPRHKHFWRELLIIVAVAAALTLMVKGFVAQVYKIPTGSMENTLQVGDRVLVNKLIYRFRGVARGDIIVFSGQNSWGPDAPQPSNNGFARLW